MRPVAETIQMPPSSERRRKLLERARLIEAARGAARRAQGGIDGGRAWINGAEVGGPDLRFAHLDRSYD